jgi:UDP-N-acetylmuramate--alanine ligase
VHRSSGSAGDHPQGARPPRHHLWLFRGGNRFTAVLRQRDGSFRRIEGIELPMPGRHNVQNALAAVAVAVEMGVSDDLIRAGFGKFGGVKRRFTKVGEIAVDGGSAVVIDDYGHHPVEIRAVLAAAREGVQNRVIAVVQPHRFPRLRDHMEDFQGAFNDADVVYVAPVYPAGEAPIEGVDAAALVEGVKARGHRSAHLIAGADALAQELAPLVQPGDMIVCLGAGDITKWAAGLADAIAQQRGAA